MHVFLVSFSMLNFFYEVVKILQEHVCHIESMKCNTVNNRIFYSVIYVLQLISEIRYYA